MIARLLSPLAIVLPWIGPATAQMGTEAAAALLEQRFEVRVLDDHVEPIMVEGLPAYRLRAIVERPDSDGTMRVVVFMVDAWTGEMISAFRHLRSGYRLPAGGGHEANRQPVDAPRRGVWR